MRHFFNRRNSVTAIVGVFCIMFVLTPVAYAQVTYTQPLTNIPGITDEATLKSITEVGLIGFINGIVRFIIQGAALASVVMIVYIGGLYIFKGGSPGEVKEMKEKIESLALGIALILGTWIILNTINPNITTSLNVLSNRKTVGSSTQPVATATGKFDEKRKPFSTLSDRDARTKAYAYADTIKSSTCTPKVDEKNRAGSRSVSSYVIYEVYCQPPN